jgi:hypothetical protein
MQVPAFLFGIFQVPRLEIEKIVGKRRIALQPIP